MSLGQMNKREAESLVEGVLTGPYSEADFRKLVVNIFPDMESKSDRWTGAYVPEAFRGGVAQYGRLGKVEDAEGYTVDILAVKLKNVGALERARTLQRNFVARYLNGGRGGVLRDAALVAFYADGSPDWRFSLVRMDYALDLEKNKVRKDFTPARRYSFLVGGNEKTHTAKRQLATLLQGGPVTLTELEKAFNIESVTKEFFEQYKALFLALKDELDGLEQRDPRIRQEFAAKHIDTATFAKRLLGQIVFLYFLQKKGWLGVGRNADGSLELWGTGPKDFLRRLFDKQVVPYDNFFDDLLEPLFYEALARERDESSFYSRFNCRIPFLNGGLFEPVGDYNWAETRINLKNETFGQIFSTFDLYNFTVREDEPLDKEVAVDPEMLGKVFENLLEVKDRKSKGAFYTPREIVHYMCQESLINYLDTALNTVTRPLAKQAPSQADLFGRPQTRQAPLTEEVYEARVPRADLAEFIRLGDAAQEHDAATATRVRETDTYSFKVPESVRQHAAQLDEALANIKICDPAIGSGAFPVGMMNEIVRARGALNAYLAPPAHPVRGGDREVGGVEGAGGINRTAYDFKRHAIQESIYGVDIEESAVDIAKLRLWLSLVVDEDDYGTIKPLPNLEYKIVIGNSLLGVKETLFNNDLFERLEKLQRDYVNETRTMQKRDLQSQVASLINNLTDSSKVFDFRIYFSEVFRQHGGFNIVIGNPPYIRIQEIPQTFAHLLKARYQSATGKFDIYVCFVEKSSLLLRKGGTVCLIIPNKFMNASYGKGLRGLISKRQSLFSILDFSNSQVFDAATTYTCILQLKHEERDDFGHAVVLDLEAFENFALGDGGFYRLDHPVTDGPWNFFGVNEAPVLSKLALHSKLGGLCDEIFQGLISGGDKYFFLELVKEDTNYFYGRSTVNKAIYPIEKEIAFTLLKGAEIRRYSPLRAKYVCVFPYELTSANRTRLINEASLAKFPKALEYFSTFKTELSGRGSVRMKYESWYAMWNPRSLSKFKTPKILTQVLASKANFTTDFDGDTMFVGGGNAGGYGIIQNDSINIYYLLGLLNSKLLDFQLKNISTEFRGGFYSYAKRFIEQLPIRTINHSDPTDKAMHNRMVALVERMLSLHEEKGQGEGARPVAEVDAEIRATDVEIDALVYRLYGLTEEEIKIVEGSGAR